MKKRGDFNFYLIFIILIIIVLAILILFNLQDIKDYFAFDELRLNDKDKEYLLDLAYNTIVTHVNEGKDHKPNNVPNKFLKFNNEVTVTIRSNGILRASQFGVGRDLINNIINASIRASNYKGHGGPIKKEELNNLIITIFIIRKEILIQDKSLFNIQKNIKLGRDGIKYVLLDQFYFKPVAEVSYAASVPVRNGWDHKKTLENLCGKFSRIYSRIKEGSLGKDCWKNPFINIFKLESIEFEKDFSK